MSQYLRSLPTRVNRQKRNHCRPSWKNTFTALANLSFLAFTLDAHISICVCVCICIARVNQSSEPSSEWHTYNYRADYVFNWKLAMFLIWWAVLSSFHKKMINKIKGRRFGTLLLSLVDKLRILLGGEKISWFSRSHVVGEMLIYIFVAYHNESCCQLIFQTTNKPSSFSKV